MGAEVGFKRIMDGVEIDMEELIRRSDAIKAIKDNSFALGDDYLEINGYGAIDDIRALPSADRPQGEWVDRSDGGRILHPWWENYECNRCGYYGSGAWNFCPNCGARMKGADDE